MSDEKKSASESGGKGRFRPGVSGNPAGRQTGTRNRATMAIDNLLDGQAEALAQRTIEMALQGDTLAMRLCLERVAPVRRGRPVHFDLPRIETAADVTMALGSVLKATAAGELTPDEASTLASVFEVKRRTLETVALERRLAALEVAAQQREDRT